MRRAVFLDRDGTINAEKGYLYKIEDFEFLPGAIAGLKKLKDAGYQLIIITNQSGIARGYYTEAAYQKLNGWMLKELGKAGIFIDGIYFCPHHPKAVIEKYRMDCPCRKPKLGMFEKAIREHDIDVAKSYAVGDKIRDCAICEVTDCKGFLIADQEEKSVIDRVKRGEVRNVMYAANLAECADRILSIRSGSDSPQHAEF